MKTKLFAGLIALFLFTGNFIAQDKYEFLIIHYYNVGGSKSLVSVSINCLVYEEARAD